MGDGNRTGDPLTWTNFITCSDETGHEGTRDKKTSDKEDPWPNPRNVSALLWDHIPMITYIAEKGNPERLLYISPGIKDILGFSPKDLINNPDKWSKILHPEDRYRVMSERLYTQKNNGPFHTQYRMVSSKGEEVLFHDESFTINDPDGKFDQYMGIMLYISNHKKIPWALYPEFDTRTRNWIKTLMACNESLRQAIGSRKLMEKSQKEKEEYFRALILNAMDLIMVKGIIKMKTELIRSEHLSQIGILSSTVAHELRNPLAVIEMACFNIRHKNRNPALEKNLESIEECLEESNQIINNLLFYSRRRLPEFKTFPICELLGECITQIQKRYKIKNIRIEAKYHLPKDTLMEADLLQMKELCCNILNNAIDAIGDEGGAIRISTELDDPGSIRIDFYDTGPGISKENLEKVQRPFFSTKSKGAGLGLAVCNQIVDLHGGQIKIQSAKGEGTNVTVTLPLRSEV